MRRLRVLSVIACVFLVAPGGKKVKETGLVPPPVVEEAPPPPPPTPGYGRLFDGQLPIALQAVPSGLASLSAQSCNACHWDAHEEWAGSAHATAATSDTFVKAVAAAGTPACKGCHLPLAQQQPERVVYDGGDLFRPVVSANPGYDATLATEGVTCAACHVRDGKVVAGRHGVEAPHPTVWSDDLHAETFCASCHQLTWPGADQPFYDTYGEWQRSAYGKAGIGCQDCHDRPSPGAPGPVGHALAADPARAVTVLVELGSPKITRGAAPAKYRVRVLNTGAGHSFPTGDPWEGVRVQASVWGPVGKKGEQAVYGKPVTLDLARTLQPAPPWKTTADTRIPAGGEAALDGEIALPITVATGDWWLEVALVPVRGGVAGQAVVSQRMRIGVE